MAIKTVFITTVGTGTYTIPVDFGSLVSVEAIGGGGGGLKGSSANGGGGGGAYAKSTTMTGLSAGLTTYYQVGTGGNSAGPVASTSSWFSLTNAAPTAGLSNGTTGVLAAAGITATSSTGGAGGTVANSTGDLRYAGGTGGSGAAGTSIFGSGGGGAAGGPLGNGGNGGNGFADGSIAVSSGGGGGSNNGSNGGNGISGTAGTGGNGYGNGSTLTGGGAGGTTTTGTAGTAGTGGGGGGGGWTSGFGQLGGNGGTGSYWTQTSDSATAGSGGGGGGASIDTTSGAGGNGGLYGGGSGGSRTLGGVAAQGIIVFTYNTAVKTVFITTPGTGTFTVPSDFVSLDSVEAIGGGGASSGGATTGGGGGGAYAKSTTVTGLVANGLVFTNVGTAGSGTRGSGGGDSWCNVVSNAAPTLDTQGVLAKGGGGTTGSAGAAGGSSASCVPTSGAFSGGSGGTASGTSTHGGGGGAAGPGGVGGNGGAKSGSSGGGGGGGGGASLNEAGSNSAADTGTGTGSNGGNGGAYTPITYISSTKTQNITNSTSLVISKPAGTIDGDLMVAFVNSNDSGTTWTGAGWTEAIDSTASAIYYKIASSEGSSYTFTNSASSLLQGYILTYRNAAWDTIGTFSTLSGSPVAPAITTTGGYNTVIAYFKAGNTTSATFTTPSPYTVVDSDSDDTATSSSSAIFSRSGFPAGTTGTVTSTISSGSLARGILLSIKPSGATGVPAGGGTGSSSTSVAGTAGTAGTGGGGGGGAGSGGATGSNGGNGATGSYWTQTSNSSTAGSGGGGGGGGGDNQAGTGGLYGGGGGSDGTSFTTNGAQGIIVFTYSYNVAAYVPSTYDVTTGFRMTDPNTNATEDLGSRYITKSYLLDAYPNIASSTGNRKAPGLWTWGYNTNGQLGNGNTTNYSSPVQVGALANWKQVGGQFHVLSIKTDGTLWAWGLNFTDGRLGFNTLSNIQYSSPTQVGALTNWKYVGHQGDHSTAIKTDGTLWAWGSNQYRQLGHVNGTNYSSPVQVGALTNWKLVDNGYYHTLAITTNGALWAWGWNLYGQLGHNTSSASVYYSSPVQVGSLTNWKSISAGGSHSSFAIKTDGTLWAWGVNVWGNLGIGSINNYYSSPVQVGTLTNWKQVACGAGNESLGEATHTLAIKTDGTLWAVGGYNALGQLGLGNTTNISTPVQVGTLTNWKSVAISQWTSFATKTDGTLWAWGYNTQGQVGNGNTSYYSSPIQIGSLTTWKSIFAGKYVAAAIQDGYI